MHSEQSNKEFENIVSSLAKDDPKFAQRVRKMSGSGPKRINFDTRIALRKLFLAVLFTGIGVGVSTAFGKHQSSSWFGLGVIISVIGVIAVTVTLGNFMETVNKNYTQRKEVRKYTNAAAGKPTFMQKLEQRWETRRNERL